MKQVILTATNAQGAVEVFTGQSIKSVLNQFDNTYYRKGFKIFLTIKTIDSDGFVISEKEQTVKSTYR